MDIWSLLQALILGIVEGATEFIPVSSTGHLILVQNWLGFTGEKANAFAIFIQLGAILAVVWLYRTKLFTVAISWPHDAAARRLILNILIATIPAVVVGLPTEKWIEAHLFKPWPVALALVLGGVAILLIERRDTRASFATIDEIPIRIAVGVGLFQILAILFPGISRSGATIMGALILGLSRLAATEFSFFLAIPVLIGASLLKLKNVYMLLTPNDWLTFSVGLVVSFVVAIIVIRRLLAYVSHNSFTVFAWYRIVLGCILLFAWRAG
ncbi:MAG: undecaprenyl-diphosphate phosphatase [Caldilineaceae bacterium]